MADAGNDHGLVARNHSLKVCLDIMCDYLRSCKVTVFFVTLRNEYKITEVKIGIIVAMDKELRLLFEQVADAEKVVSGGYTYYTGTIGHKSVVVGKCGIGKVNAALGTVDMIDRFHPDMVINTGVAGGVERTSVGDVVIASQVAYHDVWCGPGTEPGEAAGCPRFFACGVDAAGYAATLGVKYGLVASGDIFVSHPEDVQRILQMYPRAVAVDMESAAIAQTCYIRSVPMVCIRVVSDTPGHEADNASQYDNFWENAPARTFGCARNLIDML